MAAPPAAVPPASAPPGAVSATEVTPSGPTVAPDDGGSATATRALPAEEGVRGISVSTGGVRPRYPMGSRIRGEEGIVTLRVAVAPSGYATAVDVLKSSGFSALDRAAVEAARKARYTESRHAAVGGDLTFSVRFQLEG